MTVTNRCKTVTISGNAGFAIVRALRQRLETLSARRRALEGDASAAGLELHAYMTNQITDVQGALAAMAAADFLLIEGTKP